MASPRKILIADPDLEPARQLGPSLRARGFQIHLARDGSRALEVAVLRYPDLIFFDEGCRLIDARTFVQILRTNPRTEHIPVLITGGREVLDRGRELYLRKPYNPDEVVARIEEVFRRAAAAREIGSDKEVTGNLSQISVADLLQVFAMNRKSGRLVLRFDAEVAEVFLVDGRVRDARGPKVSGEKALFRYLARRQGTFEFLPGRPAVADRLRRGTDDLLLEGMRQSDELERLREALPPPGRRLALAVDPSSLPEQHPVTLEVVRLLAPGGRTLEDVVDRCSATDYETLRVLVTLLEKGVAREESDAAAPALEPLLSAAEIHGLRHRLLHGRTATSGVEVVGKLLLAAAEPESLRRAADRLAALPGFAAEHRAASVGTLGRIALGDGLRVDLVGMSTHDVLRPLWRPTAVGALAALLFDDGATGRELARWLGAEARIPVRVSPSGAPLDPLAAVRELLVAAVKSRTDDRAA